MDNYCASRGTLLDNRAVRSLEQPEKHSVHCLVDVERCYGSGMEVLQDEPNSDGVHCSAFALDDHGDDLAIALARELGDAHGEPLCTTCTGNGTGAVASHW